MQGQHDGIVALLPKVRRKKCGPVPPADNHKPPKTVRDKRRIIELERREIQLSHKNRIHTNFNFRLRIKPEDINPEHCAFKRPFNGSHKLHFALKFFNWSRKFRLHNRSPTDISRDRDCSPAIDFTAVENTQRFVHKNRISLSSKDGQQIFPCRTHRQTHQSVKFGIIGNQQSATLVREHAGKENRPRIHSE